MFTGTLHRQAVRRRGSGVLKGRRPAFCPRVSTNGHQSRSGQDQTLHVSPPRAPVKSGVGPYETTVCVHLISIFRKLGLCTILDLDVGFGRSTLTQTSVG